MKELLKAFKVSSLQKVIFEVILMIYRQTYSKKNHKKYFTLACFTS